VRKISETVILSLSVAKECEKFEKPYRRDEIAKVYAEKRRIYSF